MAAILDPAYRSPWVAKPDHLFLFKKQNGSKWVQMHIHNDMNQQSIYFAFKMKLNKLLLEIFNIISRYLISDSVKMGEEAAFLKYEKARQRTTLYSVNVYRNSTYLLCHFLSMNRSSWFSLIELSGIICGNLSTTT